MNNIMKFQIALDKVSEVSPLLIGEAQAELKAKSKEFMDEVQNSQYIKVPLVGVFSAGKSSLLNVFTQKPRQLLHMSYIMHSLNVLNFTEMEVKLIQNHLPRSNNWTQSLEI